MIFFLNENANSPRQGIEFFLTMLYQAMFKIEMFCRYSAFHLLQNCKTMKRKNVLVMPKSTKDDRFNFVIDKSTNINNFFLFFCLNKLDIKTQD
jgi:hypothetical protein